MRIYELGESAAFTAAEKTATETFATALGITVTDNDTALEELVIKLLRGCCTAENYVNGIRSQNGFLPKNFFSYSTSESGELRFSVRIPTNATFVPNIVETPTPSGN